MISVTLWQSRAVHLTDGRGRERLLVEAREDLGDGRAEALLDVLLDFAEGNGWHFVLELLQLGDDVRGQDVGAGGGDLPELDEARPEVLRDQANALRPGDARALLLTSFGFGSWFFFAAKARAGDNLAKPVAHEHRRDLAQSSEIANRREDGHVSHPQQDC